MIIYQRWNVWKKKWIYVYTTWSNNFCMYEQNTFLWFCDYEILYFMIVHFVNWRSYMYVNCLQAVRTVTVILWGHWAMSVTRSRVSASVVQAWQDSSVTSVSPTTMDSPTLVAQVSSLCTNMYRGTNFLLNVPNYKAIYTIGFFKDVTC